MRRSMLLALVAALALATGFSGSALADGGQADAVASAKKGKQGAKGKQGKRRNCKAGKRGKARGKKGRTRNRRAARRSALASARTRTGRRAARGKRGKRQRPCRGKRGKAGKGKNAMPFANGTYSDPGKGIDLVLSKGGKQAVLTFNRGVGCVPIAYGSGLAATRISGSTLSASGKPLAFGGHGQFDWEITVNRSYQYTLTVFTALELPEQTPCRERVKLQGTLKKTG